jgi:hypothetical protein
MQEKYDCILQEAQAAGLSGLYIWKSHTEDMLHLAEEKKILSEPYMLFLTASMVKPNLTQCFRLDDESIDHTDEVYSTLCYDYVEWEKQGMPPRGWRDQETIRIYF